MAAAPPPTPPPGPGGNPIWVDDITHQLQVFDDHIRRNLHLAMQFHASRLQNLIRTNAPWRDRTGNARSGLFAKAVHPADPTKQDEAIVLYHSVAYGIYLETRWAGRYAIIVPTIEQEGIAVMNSLRRSVFGDDSV